MKKLFTIDDIMVAFIAALGYGLGYSIPNHLGWSMPVCTLVCLVSGVVLEEVMNKIVFSKNIQGKPKKRILVYVGFFLIFMIAHGISVVWMKTSMFDYLGEQVIYVVGIPILGFVVNLFIRGYRVRRIRRLYGDGSEGFVFDVDKEDIEEANKQNRPIRGEYDEELAVKTRTGIYVGEKEKKIIRYRGIPYAKPPVGSLRWKAPDPLPPSEEVYEAMHFGASAIQVDHRGSIVKHFRQSEDCLTLNISISSKKTEGQKAVLVLFHTGDFTYGGTVDPLQHGDNFAAKYPDVVFVSFNYRLGILGFIDFSEVPGGEAYPDALNLGLLDQIAALQWIKENIAAFGGDPDRITVLGIDGGATSIILLSASERAKGLFRKAFVYNGNPAYAYDSPEASRALAKNLLTETKASTMEELLQLKTEDLKEAAGKLWKNMCAPTCDGTWLPTDLYSAFREGAASDIEFIIGLSSNEMNVFRAFIGEENYEMLLSSFLTDIQTYMDESIVNAMKEYVRTQAASVGTLEAKTMLAGQWNSLCVYRAAAFLKAGGNKVQLLYWDDDPIIENLGSGSVDVAAALLGTGDALQMYGSVVKADLSEALQVLLKKFIDEKPLQLYPNEIKGMSDLSWKPYPKALIVSEGKLACDTLEDRLTEVEGLFDYATEYQAGQ